MRYNRNYRRKRARKVARKFRRYARRLPAKAPRSNYLTVVRTKWAENWTFGTSTTSDFWRYYNPSISGTAGFNNFTEFQSIFDQYKVHWIKFQFRPRWNSVEPSNGTTTQTQSLPYAIIVKDPESTLSASSGLYTTALANTLLENSKAFTTQLTKPVNVFYKPAVQFPTNVGSGVTYKYSPWLRTDDITTPLRGFHMFLVNNNFGISAGDLRLDVLVTMKVSFRNVK